MEYKGDFEEGIILYKQLNNMPFLTMKGQRVVPGSLNKKYIKRLFQPLQKQ